MARRDCTVPPSSRSLSSSSKSSFYLTQRLLRLVVRMVRMCCWAVACRVVFCCLNKLMARHGVVVIVVVYW
jgi:hypothetical protein